MKAKGGEWTFEELDKFLANPRGYIPGTAMAFAGISDDQQRADVIAYLHTLSDKPASRCRRPSRGRSGRGRQGSRRGAKPAEGCQAALRLRCAGPGKVAASHILTFHGRAIAPGRFVLPGTPGARCRFAGMNRPARRSRRCDGTKNRHNRPRFPDRSRNANAEPRHELTRRSILRSASAFAAALLGRARGAACRSAALAQGAPSTGTWRHGLSLFGDLKYPADFKHFDYVNPEAPQGRHGAPARASAPSTISIRGRRREGHARQRAWSSSTRR